MCDHPHPSQAEHGKTPATIGGVVAYFVFLVSIGFILWAVLP